MKLAYIYIFVIILTCSYSALGQDNNLYVNSESLEIDYKKSVAEYKTNVFVQQKENFDLYCDNAKIFSFPKKSHNKNTNASMANIKHIELYGNITIIKESKIAKGDSGSIDPKKKLITLTGKVQLKDSTDNKETYLEGSKLQYYIDKRVFKIQNDTIENTVKSHKKRKVKVILNELE